ncbi:MAG: A/G-specific adenine glycosylase [Kiritimatiellia bacterium]
MIAKSLEAWFARVKRPMPWRLAPGPYVCWLSEIMMQQTTYATVLPYYERFLQRFPTVADLAAADESEVLKAWEGMGYYTRARNLHKAAQTLKDRWPASAAEWSAVPGVGPYTAAALASVLNGEPVPVVDGNVARVFARYWLLSDDFSKQPNRARLAERLTPEIRRGTVPGDFNQAMMELGATVCTPKNPSCGDCPLRKDCAARKQGVQADYPVKPRKGPVPVRKRTAVVIADAAGRVLLVQNREGGLLKGLWELLSVEPGEGQVQVFSHFKLELDVLRATRDDAVFCDPGTVPLATATRKVLERNGLL